MARSLTRYEIKGGFIDTLYGLGRGEDRAVNKGDAYLMSMPFVSLSISHFFQTAPPIVPINYFI